MNNRYTTQQVETLVHENMGLVITIVKSLRPPNQTEFDEYIQLGIIGLWKAIKKHDPKQAKLSTIAWDYIRWEIIRYINKSSRYNKLIRSDAVQDRIKLVAKERTRALMPSELPELLPTSLTKSEHKVVVMRNQGYTFQEIGEELGGYTRGWANKLYKSALNKIKKCQASDEY